MPPSDPPPDEHPSEPRRTTLLALIILGIFLWGMLHALGAYLFNWNIWRAVMVIACVDGFLIFWLVLLWKHNRSRR